ncbi:MAG: hypothetical protein JW893_05210 [Candidatus Omnitrophica bacterium]|nr:hypothetical protein [Candidatus Omnitrophota bacterium]
MSDLSRLDIFIRIIDANFNRAKEALRVSEDFARFALKDEKLTASFKKCRHDLTELILELPITYRKMLDVRDSEKDVGRDGWIQDGKKNPEWQDLMTSNLKRSQEALRVLEEVTKSVMPRQSPKFQRLRFRVYELEKRSFA